MSCMLALLTAAILTAAIRQRPAPSLNRYLWAQLVYIPFVWAAYWLCGEWSVGYAVVYVAFTGFILATIPSILLDCLKGWRYPTHLAATTFLLAMVLTRITFLGARASFDGYGAISLVEGFFLAWAGTLAAFIAPYTKRSDLTFTLGAFWLCQSAFSFGWTIHGAFWNRINWIVPPVTAILAFTLVWLRLRSKVAGATE